MWIRNGDVAVNVNIVITQGIRIAEHPKGGAGIQLFDGPVYTESGEIDFRNLARNIPGYGSLEEARKDANKHVPGWEEALALDAEDVLQKWGEFVEALMKGEASDGTI